MYTYYAVAQAAKEEDPILETLPVGHAVQEVLPVLSA